MNMTMRMELFVEDVAAIVDFYTRVLGFSILGEANDDYTFVRHGAVYFGICRREKSDPAHHFDQASFAHRKGLGVETVLEVDDLEAIYQRVLEAGYPVTETLVERPWGGFDFRMVGPDGYYLRLTDSQIVAHGLKKLNV